MWPGPGVDPDGAGSDPAVVTRRAYDQFGNPVTNYSDPVTLSDALGNPMCGADPFDETQHYAIPVRGVFNSSGDWTNGHGDGAPFNFEAPFSFGCTSRHHRDPKLPDVTVPF